MKKILFAVQTLLLLAAAPNVQAQKSYDLKNSRRDAVPKRSA